MSLLEIKSEAQRVKERLQTVKDVFDVFDKAAAGPADSITPEKLRNVLTMYNSDLTVSACCYASANYTTMLVERSTNGAAPQGHCC